MAIIDRFFCNVSQLFSSGCLHLLHLPNILLSSRASTPPTLFNPTSIYLTKTGFQPSILRVVFADVQWLSPCRRSSRRWLTVNSITYSYSCMLVQWLVGKKCSPRMRMALKSVKPCKIVASHTFWSKNKSNYVADDRYVSYCCEIVRMKLYYLLHRHPSLV